MIRVGGFGLTGCTPPAQFFSRIFQRTLKQSDDWLVALGRMSLVNASPVEYISYATQADFFDGTLQQLLN
jgi:hypothetical protein